MHLEKGHEANVEHSEHRGVRESSGHPDVGVSSGHHGPAAPADPVLDGANGDDGSGAECPSAHREPPHPVPIPISDGLGMSEYPFYEEDRTVRAEAYLVSLSILGVYYNTLTPTISGGDSGEVMAAACSWGPAHPPGYPLFVALAQLAMHGFASLGENKAYRVNLLCVIMTAMAVYNLHRTVRIVTRSASAAMVGAGMYGLSPLIWNNAVQVPSRFVRLACSPPADAPPCSSTAPTVTARNLEPPTSTGLLMLCTACGEKRAVILLLLHRAAPPLNLKRGRTKAAARQGQTWPCNST